MKLLEACRCYDDRADRIEHKAQWLVEQAYDTEDGQAKVIDPMYWRELREALLLPHEGVPMLLHCPECRTRHIDKGEFATKLHHTHSCQACGLTWRPAIVHTVGVQFLPGFRDEDQ
jgi:predicted RNA-binding Zn-ribbon protein involved in translation (DUF1610 family)